MREFKMQDYRNEAKISILKRNTEVEMKTISLIQFAASLERSLDYVADSTNAITLSRKGKGDVVLISKKEYGSIMETLYLLGNINNAKRLIESFEQLERGEVITINLPD